MNEEELNLYSLSKLTIKEILIEEQIEYLGEFRFRSFKLYLTNQKALKRKLITSKILGAFIFGILPIIPLLSYFQILEHITSNPASIRIILFGGSIIFGVYFLLQFFNFFLMAVLNITRIMSGRIFDWYRTLPISREKLRKLIMLTIIRSSDIPLIVITFALPVLMFIGTQNLIIALVSFGVSILNTIFSFCVVVLFGERLNRILDINESGSKKTNKIRLINMISYIIIIIGSIFLIQWSFTALEGFFDWFVSINYNSIVILILSMIPFPLSSGFLISSFIAPTYVPLHIWYNILVGSGLFIILIYFVYNKALREIKKRASLKFKTSFKSNVFDKELKIKFDTPVIAYIRKDLLITFRDLKTFLSVIMPIILSFIFVFTYNLTSVGGQTPFDIDLIYNWAIMLAFNILISGMLVFSLLDIGDTENSVLSSLPLVPRDQAKAKLFLMSLIQIIAVMGPSLIYINSPKFFDAIITVLSVLPFAFIFLFSMFIMRIYFFSKLKEHYVIEEIYPENKIFKQILIFVECFSLYFFIYSFAFNIYSNRGIIDMVLSLFIVVMISFIIVILIFNNMFPTFKKSEKKIIKHLREEYQAWDTKQSWISIFFLLVFHFLLNFLIWFAPYPIFPHSLYENQIENEIYKFLNILNINFIYTLLLIIIINKVLVNPKRKQLIRQDLDNLGSKWRSNLSKKIIWSVFYTYLIIYFNLFLILLLISKESIIPLRFTGLSVILDFSYFFWQEVALGGIILTILLRNFRLKRTIIPYALIISMYQLVSLFIYILIHIPSEYYISPSDIIFSYIYLFSLMLIFIYLFLYTDNIISGFIVALIVNSLLISLLLLTQKGILIFPRIL